MGFAGRRLLEMGVILSGRIVGATLVAFARFLRSSVAGKGGAENVNGLLLVLVLALGLGVAALAFTMVPS